MSEEDLQDMEQEAMLVMLKTYEKYDNTKSQFNTFLTPRIKGFYIDYLEKEGFIGKIKSEQVMDLLSEEIENVFQTPDDETEELLARLHLVLDDIQGMVSDLSEDELMSDIKYSLYALPKVKLKIVVSYFVLNKSIKEISKELGYDENSGWVYKMKKQAVDKIRQQLKSKGFYIP